MKSRQQAQREEQQRIKNLVLNYDLRDSEDQDGDNDSTPSSLNSNIHTRKTTGSEKPSSYHPVRLEKPPKERGGQRVRRLQMNDLDWYDKARQSSTVPD
jgi:regulator of nonsense transcripts 2